MTTTDDLDKMIEQTNNIETSNTDQTSEEFIKENDEKEAESNLKKDLDTIDDSSNNDAKNDNYDEVYEREDNDNENNEDENKKDGDSDNGTSTENVVDENINSETDNEENNNSDDHTSKFFDPFELNIDDEEDENTS
ncbi:hypothetical protein IKO50_04105 [bacterium]|nr:hypothetical protein [bacterium]